MCIRTVQKVSHCSLKFLGLSRIQQIAKHTQWPDPCQNPVPYLLPLKLFEYSWISLGCMAALFLPRDSPLSRVYLHDLCITAVFYSSVLHYKSHYSMTNASFMKRMLTLCFFGEITQSLQLQGRCFPCIAPAQDFFFLFRCKEWAELTFIVISWPYIHQDTCQFSPLNSMLYYGFPFHSVQKPSVVY